MSNWQISYNAKAYALFMFSVRTLHYSSIEASGTESSATTLSIYRVNVKKLSQSEDTLILFKWKVCGELINKL
jgi:hypothetical protein